MNIKSRAPLAKCSLRLAATLLWAVVCGLITVDRYSAAIRSPGLENEVLVSSIIIFGIIGFPSSIAAYSLVDIFLKFLPEPWMSITARILVGGLVTMLAGFLQWIIVMPRIITYFRNRW
jgi:hypothetical protein